MNGAAMDSGYAASSAFHISGARPSLTRSFPSLNWPFRIRCMRSTPAIVIEAFRNRFKPSMAPKRCLIDRRSCSMRLFRYFDDRISVRAPPRCCLRTSRAARYPSSVILCGRRPRLANARPKNALAAATSRLARRRKSTVFLDSSVEVGPAAFDLDVGLVDAPRSAHWASKTAPPFFEFWNIALDPAHIRRVSQRQSVFGHHFHEVSVAELVLQIPAHAENDDFPIEMPAFEKIIDAQHRGHPIPPEIPYPQLCLAHAVCTRALVATRAGAEGLAPEAIGMLSYPKSWSVPAVVAVKQL